MKKENTCPVCGCHKNADRDYCMECMSYDEELRERTEKFRRQQEAQKRTNYFQIKHARTEQKGGES